MLFELQRFVNWEEMLMWLLKSPWWLFSFEGALGHELLTCKQVHPGFLCWAFQPWAGCFLKIMCAEPLGYGENKVLIPFSVFRSLAGERRSNLLQTWAKGWDSTIALECQFPMGVDRFIYDFIYELLFKVERRSDTQNAVRT